MTTTKQQRREATMLTEALAYGQQLHEDYRDDPREEVKRVLREAFSLLAYTDPRGSVVGHLLEESGRREVAEELNSAILGNSHSTSFVIDFQFRWERVRLRRWKWLFDMHLDWSGNLSNNGVMNASLINVKDDFVV